VALLFTELPRKVLPGTQASAKFDSRKLSFRRCRFSETEFPVLCILGNWAAGDSHAREFEMLSLGECVPIEFARYGTLARY
jgi:hypothetical protein